MLLCSFHLIPEGFTSGENTSKVVYARSHRFGSIEEHEARRVSLFPGTSHELRNEIQEVAEQCSFYPGFCVHLRALVSANHCFLPLFSCLHRIPTETEVDICKPSGSALKTG